MWVGRSICCCCSVYAPRLGWRTVWFSYGGLSGFLLALMQNVADVLIVLAVWYLAGSDKYVLAMLIYGLFV